MATYQVERGLPKQFQPPLGTFRLAYTPHAMKEASMDPYGDISQRLPAALDTEKAKLLEVETDHRGHAVKLLYRLKMSHAFDVCLVVVPNRQPWGVKTVWRNRRDD